MDDVERILRLVPHESFIERLIGNVNVERRNGTVDEGLPMFCKEKLLDEDDIESVYEREYVAIKEGDGIEEIFLGNDKGETIILKERS